MRSTLFSPVSEVGSRGLSLSSPSSPPVKGLFQQEKGKTRAQSNLFSMIVLYQLLFFWTK